MKKLLFKLIALVSLVAVAFGTFAGCALFEVNQDRDMAQVVASVDISAGADAGVKTDIYKRDLTAGYYSYGYYYVQNYGYTTAKAYQLILDNLVNNAVIIQQSKKELAGEKKGVYEANNEKYKDVLGENAKVITVDDVIALNDGKGEDFLSLIASDNDIANYTAKKVGEVGYTDGLEGYVKSVYTGDLKKTDASFRFVGDVNEILKAVSDGIDNVNSFIESFMDDTTDDEHNHEELTYTARTTPTMDAEDEEIDVEACIKKINDDKTGLKSKLEGDRLKAFKKGYKRLQEIGLLETDASNDRYFENDGSKTAAPTILSVLQLDYFKNNIQSALDSKLVDVYEKALRADKVASDDELWDQYVQLGEKQGSEYNGDISSLETALGEVSSSKFVVYNSHHGYGYVSHLVIEFTEEQKALISDKKAEKDVTKDQIAEYVKSLAGDIVVKDLRESWVKSNYGTYNIDDKSFTFSDKYVYNTADKAWNLATYKGTIDDVRAFTEETDDDKLELKFTFGKVTPTELGYTDFVDIVNSAFGFDSLALDDVKKIDGYAEKSYTERKEILNRFEDIKFAFSTDTGNFNSYLGYLYSPYTSKDTYVTEFVEAAGKAVKGGEGSVVMFMSESYGLHVLVCTAVEGGQGYYTTKDAFIADLDVKGTVAYNFKEANKSLIESNYVSAEADRFIKNYTNDKSGAKDTNAYITYHEKAYKDLVTESAS